MINAARAKEPAVPVKTVDQDRFFPFFISTIANKISRGGSRVYLRLFGIGIIEWRILYVLADSTAATAQAICNKIELDKAAASRSIQVLERLGYITTQVDPRDGRKRTLSLTPEGVLLHDRVLKVSLQREQRLLAGFSNEEREQFLGLLRRMHANAIEMNGCDYADGDNDDRAPKGEALAGRKAPLVVAPI
jgi:DNA-binding MarR family transcriptional regulator